MDKVKHTIKKPNKINYIYESKRIRYHSKDFEHDYLLIFDIHEYNYLLVKNNFQLKIKNNAMISIYYNESSKKNQIVKNTVIKTDDLNEIVLFLRKKGFNLMKFIRQ